MQSREHVSTRFSRYIVPTTNPQNEHIHKVLTENIYYQSIYNIIGSLAMVDVTSEICIETILLNAAKEGDLETIQRHHCSFSTSTSRSHSKSNTTITPSTYVDCDINHNHHHLASIADHSGCTLLHWSAGNGHKDVTKYLLNEIYQYNPNIPVRKSKARGRTPLHYACRNGHLDVVKMLIEEYNADVFFKAKHGVTPFQLAVWQNQLEVCKYLVNKCGVIVKDEVNDFGCSVVHWCGIVPMSRLSNDDSILELFDWIISHEGIDIHAKQNQGHTILHKASWGGHFHLVKYLHRVHGMMDIHIDHAGNYAADLADMANTSKHEEIALYLRRDASLEFHKSCEILKLNPVVYMDRKLNEDELRKIYLSLAKEVHPDRVTDDGSRFQELKRAYEHLTSGGVATAQRNPTHSMTLLLEMTRSRTCENEEQDEKTIEEDASSCENRCDGMNILKTRLVSVLLEYGNKGLDLSNLIKKWNQVWPNNPFPLTEKQRKKGQLLRFLQDNAGDVFTVKRQEKAGSIYIIPKHISREEVAMYSMKQNE